MPKIACSALLAVSLCASTAAANVLPYFGQKRLWREADLIVIGTPIGPPDASDWRKQPIAVRRVLKGAFAGSSLDIITETMISERNPQCCAMGRIYRLYLTGTPKRGYQTVDGHYGAVAIKRNY